MDANYTTDQAKLKFFNQTEMQLATGCSRQQKTV